MHQENTATSKWLLLFEFGWQSFGVMAVYGRAGGGAGGVKGAPADGKP